MKGSQRQMKHILITGVNSYVGNSLADWLAKWPQKYHVEKISLRDTLWKERDFSSYDVVVHVAGIAHVSTDPKMEEMYYRVNRDLTIEVAKKAKKEKVKQFIFMSSIIVYGKRSTENGVINKGTVPIPDNFYGKSKLEAEEKLNEIKSENFKVAIIRPPMIYGKDSKGNYPKLARLARITPIFPDFPNKRSVLYIDNLSELLKLIIENEEQGTFFPQNKEYVRTSELVTLIAEAHNKTLIKTKIFNPFILLLIKYSGLFNKVFGNLLYSQEMSLYKEDYYISDLRKSIENTELECRDFNV